MVCCKFQFIKSSYFYVYLCCSCVLSFCLINEYEWMRKLLRSSQRLFLSGLYAIWPRNDKVELHSYYVPKDDAWDHSASHDVWGSHNNRQLETNLDERFLFEVESLTSVGKLDEYADVIQSKQLFKLTTQRRVHSRNLRPTLPRKSVRTRLYMRRGRYRDVRVSRRRRDRDAGVSRPRHWSDGIEIRDETETFKKRLATGFRRRRSRQRLQPWWVHL